MKKAQIIFWQFLIALIPALYLLSIWGTLPDTIPTHFNANFEADRFGKKSEILVFLLIMVFVSMVISLLLNNLNRIDPKKRYEGTTQLMMKISWTVVVFLSLLSTLILYTTAHYTAQNSGSLILKYIFALVALLFAAMGYFMKNLKPNYFVGIRTPWTLENEENWRKTHLLGSKIWVWGGMITFFLVLFIPGAYAHYIFICAMIPMALIPIGYSFLLFREKQRMDNPQ